MLVEELMVKEVITVSPFATLKEALSLMKKHRLKSLVVEKTKESDAYGLITYTNIIKTVIAESGDINLLNVYDVCIKPVISVGSSLDIKHVAELMSQNRIKRIVVLENNTLVGLITMGDLVEELMRSIE
jgi:CBS domain-containing protein